MRWRKAKQEEEEDVGGRNGGGRHPLCMHHTRHLQTHLYLLYYI